MNPGLMGKKMFFWGFFGVFLSFLWFFWGFGSFFGVLDFFFKKDLLLKKRGKQCSRENREEGGKSEKDHPTE